MGRGWSPWFSNTKGSDPVVFQRILIWPKREYIVMDEVNLGTIKGKPITKELLDELAARCEKDWTEDEVSVVPTDHVQALAGRGLTESGTSWRTCIS